MANKVFANGREIACKAASGKSIAAFPDVCFTPPLTPATPPGVPIPYPNTGMASDTSDGSKTVQISGKEVMLKNVSCFSKSSGDEAGSAPKKGVVTSVNRGKVYFNCWSMDVKFEGSNVDRHLDLTTHNHAGSMPGNTPPMAYTDGMAAGGGGGERNGGCAAGPTTGSPVNPVLGAKVLAGPQDLDFTMPGVMPLRWQRHYLSANPRIGWWGRGWGSVFECSLEASDDGGIDFIDEHGRRTEFPWIGRNDRFYSRYEKTTLLRKRNDEWGLLRPDGTTLWFASSDSRHFALQYLCDRNDNTIALHYEGGPQPIGLSTSGGQRLGLLFDHNARLLKVVLGSGVSLVRYTYDEFGQLRQVFDRAGDCTRAFEWEDGLMVMHRHVDFVSHYQYDTQAIEPRVLRHWNNVGQAWTFDYQPGFTRVTDQIGRVTRYHVDLKQRWTGTTDALGQKSERYLDSYGDLVAWVDAAGARTLYEYDERSRMVGIIAPDGAETRFEWHPTLDLPAAITDALGQRTEYGYDERGNLIQQKEPGGRELKYELDARGLSIAIDDSTSGRSQLTWDGTGLLIDFADCSGQHTRYAYNAQGWLTSETDALGLTTYYGHDARGHRSSVRWPSGMIETMEHDLAGQLVCITDGNGNTTRNEWAADGLPMCSINALGHSLVYEYDAARRIIGLLNENGVRHTMAYDALDRLIEETGFDGKTVQYEHDAVGEIVLQREMPHTPDEIETRFERDLVGRIHCKKLRGGGLQRRVDYVFDPIGRLRQAEDVASRVRFDYHPSGAITAEHLTRFVASGELTTVLRHECDAAGRRTGTTLPDGRTLRTLTYGAGHIHQTRFDGRVIADVERDAVHRESTRMQGQLTTRYGYDALGMIASEALVGPNEVEATRRYSRDAEGRVTSITDSRIGITRYEYDPIGRLVGAHAIVDERFSFDPAHNRVDTPGDVAWHNQVEHVDGHRFQYDVHGRVVYKREGSRRDIEMQWDLEHRLVASVSHEHGEATSKVYDYDVFGRRLSKQTGSTTITYLWDRNRLLGESTANSRTTFIYAGDSYRPLAQVLDVDEAPSAIFHYHLDHLGTPFMLTDEHGAVSWETAWKAWGEEVDEAAYLDARAGHADVTPLCARHMRQPLRFQGQYYDPETGFHYNRFRYYDPQAGKFLSADPIGLAGGSNGYTYGASRPTMFVDPWGLAPPNPRQAEYEAYKRRCNEPLPPGLDSCAAARWKLARNQDCRNMRQAWDDKWQPGRHAGDLTNLDTSIARLKTFIANNCP
jgi:RHS repeat-associated protein